MNYRSDLWNQYITFPDFNYESKFDNLPELEKIPYTQEDIERLENEQGWHFMKKLDGDCVYVGYHFVNKGTIGINGNGEVVNFDQNESFALVGR